MYHCAKGMLHSLSVQHRNIKDRKEIYDKSKYQQ